MWVTFTCEQFALVKGESPPAPVSVIQTKYVAWARLPGSRTFTRLVDPSTVVILFAEVVAAAAPKQLVEKVAVILAGVIWPAGKPDR